LTISTGTWTNAPTGYAYQWQRCDQSGTCAAVVGATAASYQPAVADIGSTFKVEVSATNIAGTSKVLSSTSATVLGKPTVVTAPRISGVAAVKRKLTAQAGAWTSAPTSFSYQWLRCNAAGKGGLKITRATGPIYKPVAADAGKTLRVSVFAKNIVGTTGTKTATRKVAIKR
jgi:hypothetical protein